MPGDDTSNYAPKSPDLSSFYSAGPTQPAPQPPNHNTHHHSQTDSEYKLERPGSGYDYASSYAPLPLSLPPNIVGQPLQPLQPEYAAYAPSVHDQYLAIPTDSAHNPVLQPAYGLQETHYQPTPYGHPFPHPHQYPSGTEFPQSFAPISFPIPPTGNAPRSSEMPPRKAAAPPPPVPVIEPSPVRTKFPTARIKRIMQADEEVGKVAQQTPIAVGKALELFMIQLVRKSADIAKDKGSKRVTAQMLKQVVETDEQWDFLRDIVSRVENEREGSKPKAKPESESEEEMDIVEPKKKGRGGRRKKA